MPQHLSQGDRSLQSQGEDCHLLSPQSWLWGHLAVPLRFPSWHAAGGEDLSQGPLDLKFSQVASISLTVFVFRHVVFG